MYLIKLGRFLAIIFSSILSVPFSVVSFWDSHNAYVGLLDGIPHIFMSLLIFFSSSSSDFIISIVFPSCLQILSSACSNMMLNISNTFFNFNYLTFWVQNVFWFFLIVSISLSKFSFYSYAIFLTSIF